MRLLERKSDGEFTLTQDLIDNIPPYAIISHTWGPDIEDVTFRALMDGTGKSKLGYEKISFCGEQAERNSLQYFWMEILLHYTVPPPVTCPTKRAVSAPENDGSRHSAESSKSSPCL
jgi:hypothetical protein